MLSHLLAIQELHNNMVSNLLLAIQVLHHNMASNLLQVIQELKVLVFLLAISSISIVKVCKSCNLRFPVKSANSKAARTQPTGNAAITFSISMAVAK